MWREIDTINLANFVVCAKFDKKENFLYSPNDIVDTDNTLRLLFVENDRCLGDDPHEATVSCQETVSVGLCLPFADY